MSTFWLALALILAATVLIRFYEWTRSPELSLLSDAAISKPVLVLIINAKHQAKHCETILFDIYN